MNRRNERFFRKQLLIHPKFQLTLIGLNWGVITLLFAGLRVESSRMFSALSPLGNFVHETADFDKSYLLYQADHFNTTLLLAYFVAIVVSGLVTLIVSYRFAGPLCRLKSYFTELGQANKPVRDLHFRTGDFFSDLPPLINSAIKRCRYDGDSATKESGFLKTGSD